MVMDPQQQSQNPYGFIMDTDHKQKSPLFSMGSSPKSKIIFAVLAVIFLLVLYTIVSRVFLNKTDKYDVLISVRAQQQEVIRIATLGLTDAKDDTTINYTQTILSSVSSDQAQVAAIMQKAGMKINKETLAARKNPKTDAALAEAEKNNTYDDTLTAVLQAQMKIYQKDLSSAYDVLSSNQAKVTVQVAHKSAALVLQ